MTKGPILGKKGNYRHNLYPPFRDFTGQNVKGKMYSY